MQQEQEPTRRPLFSLGDVVITPGALTAFVIAQEYITPYLARHQQGAWGDLDLHDRRANEQALTQGTRLLSAYHLRDGTKIWIWVRRDNQCNIPV